jgi:hypothetical protein
MKFKYKPNVAVTDRKTHKLIGVFDEHGILECNDPRLIPRLKSKFPVFEEYVCRKCGGTFDTKGLLLAHHRKVHNDSK